MTISCTTLATELGQICLAERDGHLLALEFDDDVRAFAARWPREEVTWHDGRGSRARQQLVDYLAGRRRDFDVPLAAAGTPFQLEVWRALGTVPFGATCSYADIAARIGRPTAVRAVGAANGKNPIAIVVPCHRVIGRDGSLTGYAGGLARKQWLLAHEERASRSYCAAAKINM